MSLLLYIDSQVLVISKSAGEAVETRDSSQQTVVQQWRTMLDLPDLQPVHRIDQPVAGLVILSRTRDAQAALHQQFREGTVDRSYLAIVTKPPESEAASISDRILVDQRTYQSRIDPKGKESTLDYHVAGTTDHHTILLVQLRTGRHHQIRLQLSHHGMPILGDARYGARRPMKDRSIGLLAWQVRWRHPLTGQLIRISAPFPQTPLWQSVAETVAPARQDPGSFLSTAFRRE